MLIRSAMSIGLHRDPGHFRLQPLEGELRRRLWWQILVQDHRGGEDHGFAVHGLESRCDTHLPLNIDDEDLRANATTLPSCRRGWTKMSTFLLTAEISIAIQKTRRDAHNQSSEDSTLQLQNVGKLKAHLEDTYLQHCDVNIPIQKATLLTSWMLLTKLEFLVHQQGLTSEQSQQNKKSIAERAFAAACRCIELSIEVLTDDILRGYRWLYASYNQFHCLAYLLWHLCGHPTDPCAERAWPIVEKIFDMTERDQTKPVKGTIWNVMRHLRHKAKQIRQETRQPGLSSTDAAAFDSTQGPLERPIPIGPEDSNAVIPSLDPTLFAEWMDFSENLDMFQFDL
jgi:hypothetical protein